MYYKLKASTVLNIDEILPFHWCHWPNVYTLLSQSHWPL